MDKDLLSELKEIVQAYECEPCEEESKLAMATGKLASLKGDDLFAPDLLVPPAEWFNTIPEEVKDLPVKKIYIFDDGRVAGRVTDWDQCILDGSKDCWRAPKLGDYTLAYQSVTEIDDGSVIATMDLAVTEGHAPVLYRNNWEMSLAFNTGEIDVYGDPIDDAEKAQSKIARVRAMDGPDGLWVLGAVYPTITARQVVLAKSTPWSGHWQPVPNKGMQFLGVVTVNRPGLPQLAKVATYSGYAYVPEGTQVIEMSDDKTAAETTTEEAPSATTMTETQQPGADLTELTARVSALETELENVKEENDVLKELVTTSAVEDLQLEELLEDVQEALADTEGERQKLDEQRKEIEDN